ncbi:MAG: PAS domain S-box protein, partial [Opitutaceae bacterium]|nr:PAS domain S-box protein [Opitutaceae bacterium]
MLPWLMGVAGILGTAFVLTRGRESPPPKRDEVHPREEPWRHLFEHSSEAMVVSQPDGTYTAANHAACAILQMTEAEIKLLGRSLIVPPPGVDLDELIRRRTTTGSVTGEMQLRRKDGTLVIVEGSSSLVALEDGQRRVITVFRDVTLSKRQREAALNQARRWQAALEAAGDGLWDWNVETGEVYFSATWKRMLGYSPEEISDHVDEWKRLVHPDDFDATMTSVSRHLAGETEFYRCEHRVRCKDGTYKWILDCGCVVDRAGDGRPLRMLGTHKDLSASRAIQQKLADSEEKFHQAFHHAPLIMVVTNLSDGRILEANAMAQKVSGIDPSEGLGRSVVELGWFTESDRERLVSLLSSQGKVTDLEMTARSRSGATVICLVNCQLVVMGGEQRVITTLQDITARRRADAELRESRENYLGLFNTVSEAIYVHDAKGVFLDVNVGATAMYGYAKEELVGKTPADVSAPGRNDLEAVQRASSEVFATGRPVSFEFWAVRKNGQVFPKACVTHRGKYFGQDVLITTARDITAQRQAEQALLRSELRFRTLFQYSPFGAMEEDFSAVKSRMDMLRARGVSDFKAYLKAHPEEVLAMADLVRIIMVNQGASLMFGVPVEVPDQFHLSSSLSPDSLPIFAEELAALAEGRTVFHTELVGVNSKGQPINLDLTLTVQPGHEEHLDRVVVSFIDITERKVSEARIREQAALLDVTQDAILVLSLDRTVTFWNRGAERLYGISKEEALGKAYEGMVYRDPPENYNAEWSQVLPLREWANERHHVSRIRGEVTVQKRATVVRNEKG